eukprot:TRINITY_DN11079_c0_g2_i4.p1 TRINITY_DN11079_c0_g2~~TRINITY_DN11079_c0_g2_i4.p1  ORF type:complete len:145 (-),score=1.53 TRINITY_DN11079_c0_g2_i4:28-462(-)
MKRSLIEFVVRELTTLTEDICILSEFAVSATMYAADPRKHLHRSRHAHSTTFSFYPSSCLPCLVSSASSSSPSHSCSPQHGTVIALGTHQHSAAVASGWTPAVAAVRWAPRLAQTCLLYTSDAADEEDSVDLGGRRIIKKKKSI